MAITIVGVEDGTSTSGGAATVTKPAGTAAGDLLIAFQYEEWGTYAGMTTPTGFTLLAGHNDTAGGGSEGRHLKILTRVADGTEPASWSGQGTGGADTVLVIYALRDVDTAASIVYSITEDLDFVSPSITPAAADDLLIVGVMNAFNSQSTRTFTTPAGLTEQSDTSAVWAAMVTATRQLDSAAATAEYTFTPSGASTRSGSQVQFALAIAPSGGGAVDGEVTAVPATATAGAVAPVVAGSASVTATLATASSAAVAPVALGGAETASVAAAASALAEPPTVTGSTVLSGGGPATATATAHPPVVAGGAGGDGAVVAVAATATAQALPPTLTADYAITAVAATATAAALPPAVASGAVVVAVVATATGQALPPVVSGGAGDASVTAVRATATARAWAPTVVGIQNGTVVVPVIIATAQARVPAVEVAEAVYRFEPPTHEEPIQSNVGALHRYTLTYAKTIYRTEAGTFAARRMPPAWLVTGEEGVDYFLGGRVYEVSPEVAAELTAAGYSPVYVG